jgi:deoxycytidylate deaminase
VNLTNGVVKRAVWEAQQSSSICKVGAVLFEKKKIVSSGYNQSQRNIPWFKVALEYQRWPNSLHAEVAAILASRGDVRGLSLFVVRVNNYTQFRFSKPCPHCMGILRERGIRKIFYSIDHYPYIEELIW